MGHNTLWLADQYAQQVTHVGLLTAPWTPENGVQEMAVARQSITLTADGDQVTNATGFEFPRATRDLGTVVAYGLFSDDTLVYQAVLDEEDQLKVVRNARIMGMPGTIRFIVT